MGRAKEQTLAGAARWAALVAALLISSPASAEGVAGVADQSAAFVAETCGTIEREARRRALPAGFFARLIWQESRFNAGSVSPKGASGIAQFMPGTAAERGLADPFEPKTALAASAAFLQELKYRLGNLGLAAAGYNAGPDRVRRWLDGASSLPAETRAYVAAITGLSAEAWSTPGVEAPDFALHPKLAFADACEDFARRARPMPRGEGMGARLSPWGVLIASHFSESAVRETVGRLAVRHDAIARSGPVEIARRRNPSRGGRLMFEALLGVADRTSGTALCARLHRSGASCMVVKN